jgi:hypothetical protein
MILEVTTFSLIDTRAVWICLKNWAKGNFTQQALLLPEELAIQSQ